jgi:hypothetical protein
MLPTCRPEGKEEALPPFYLEWSRAPSFSCSPCSGAGIPICSRKRNLRQPDPQNFDTLWVKAPFHRCRQ